MSKSLWLSLPACLALLFLVACATEQEPPLDPTTGAGATGASSSGQGGTGEQGGAGGGSAAKCGDSVVEGDEACDDDNTDEGDGCDGDCQVEAGYQCSDAQPSVCATVCGDGVVTANEQCDDQDKDAGDGCAADCEQELGWHCEGSPSSCVTQCGDGVITEGEQCDDLNAADGDGCGTACEVEPGFGCVNQPSVCLTFCGDGIVVGVEECDDDNVFADDGCDPLCVVEPTFVCNGEPSLCVADCGDGLVKGTEECDDGNLSDGDGCSASCLGESGYACGGEPSVCVASCGDGLITASEECDDLNLTNGDGCNYTCHVEPGYVCNGASPTICIGSCGDGFPVAGEVCDDGNIVGGDGCDPYCNVETGFVCSNIPSICVTICGDGVVGGEETCDDGDAVPDDGCSSACAAEIGWTCIGTPSTCSSTCGDGVVVGIEACDDGNSNDGDCCSAACQPEGFCEVEPNDTAAQANVLPIVNSTGSMRGSIVPIGDQDYYVITVPTTVDLKLETSDGNGVGSCAAPMDTVIYLYASDGTTQVATDDDDGTGNCSLIQPSSDAGARHLAAGTYYVRVIEFGSNAVVDVYKLFATFTAVCGDGVTQGYEGCDGGANCTATCDLLAICGDGIVVAPEQCDDGNTSSGDGCSSTCQNEVVGEIEPNGTPAEALANGPFPVGLLWGGSVNPIADQDYYRLDISTTVDLRIETFDGSGPSSCVTIDPQIFFYASDGTTQLATDDQDGVNSCALIQPSSDTGVRHLLPGTYYLRFKRWNDTAVIPAYTVLATYTAVCGNGIQEGYELCDGTPNCGPTCNMCGDGLITAPETCDDSNAAAGDGCSSSCLVEPNWYCSGTPSTCQPVLCGDGLLVGPESCDDGNATSGDGCTAACALEPNWLCSGVPSTCAPTENVCNDGIDNDGDGQTDCNDSNCSLGCAVAPCAAGESLLVFNSTDVPKVIPDVSSSSSLAPVGFAGTVQRAVVRVSINHTNDTDLDISMQSPTGTSIELSTDNGSSNDNYINTIFDTLCSTNITSGAAPFTGCFKPEQALTAFSGQQAGGSWRLTVADDLTNSPSQTGTLTAWSLAICASP